MKKGKIPTLLGLVLVVVGVAITVVLVGRGGRLIPRAKSTCQPENVQITNFSDKHFSVAWTTEEECMGSAVIIDGQTENVFLDERNKDGSIEASFKTHFVNVENLEPEKEYRVLLISGQSRFGLSGSINATCKETLTAGTDIDPLRLTMAYELSTISIRSQPLNGTVMNEEEPAGGAIVCIDIEGLAPLSALVSGSGFWMIPLSGILQSNLSTEVDSLPDGLTEEISVIGEDDQKSFAFNTTGNDDPVPIIYLGNNYDFINDAGGASPVPEATTPTLGPTGPGFNLSEGDELTIISPEGEVEDTLPTFQGRGKPGASLEITIESETMEATIQVDSNGFWTFVPPKNLDPGEHKVTVKFIDENGVIQTIARTFIVTGSSPLFPDRLATGSGSTTPTLSPTPTTALLGLTPTLSPTPTEAHEYSTPTIEPVPTEVVYDGELPTTASNDPFNFILTTGIIGATLGTIVIIIRKKL